MAKEKTAIGRYTKETLNAGILMPDSKMIPIVEEYLARDEYKNGYILDGFPRTLPQAKLFKDGVDYAIYLEVPDTEALWRIAHRNNSEREDETLIAIKKRIELFHKFTTQVTEHYEKKSKLIRVDGTAPIKVVNEFILKSLSKTIGKNGVTNWRKRKKVILAFVGLPGSAKSTAAVYFQKKGLPVIRLGAITDEVLKQKGLDNNIENNKKVREELRKEQGMDAYIRLNMAKINQHLDQEKVVVIDGLRSYEEYITLKKEFKNVFVVAITADKRLRYQRIKNRKERSNLSGEERDIQEVLGLNMGPTLAFADKTIVNNSTLVDFEDKLEELYRQVYYGMS